MYVLHKFPEGVDYIKLFKIIYFAQKEYLATYGKVLCPDTFKARTFGPVPALPNKVIKLVEFENDDMDSYPDLRGFCPSIRVKEQMVYALAEPDMDYLSQRHDMMRHAYFQEIKHRVKMAPPRIGLDFFINKEHRKLKGGATKDAPGSHS